MSKSKTALTTAGCVGLVVGAFLAPAGRWTYADRSRVEDVPTCTTVTGETGCLIPPETVPPVVATGDPPVPSRFEQGPAPQAPSGTVVDPNADGDRP